MSQAMRKAVSRDKRRLKVGEYDLDLTYITPRVIAMGFPADSVEKAWRNNINDVSSFLDDAHRRHYMVYNLSQEKYDIGKFHGRVVDVGFPDHSAPPLELLHALVLSIDQYLSQDPKNVVAIHCLAGRGRTGTVIVAYFLYTRMFSDVLSALHHFAFERSSVGEGVQGPNQLRFLHYYYLFINKLLFTPSPSLSPIERELLVKGGGGVGEYSLRRSPLVEILGIELKNPPFYGDGYIVPHVKVYSFKNAQRPTYKLNHEEIHYFWRSESKPVIIETRDCVVSGDFQIKLYHRTTKRTKFMKLLGEQGDVRHVSSIAKYPNVPICRFSCHTFGLHFGYDENDLVEGLDEGMGGKRVEVGGREGRGKGEVGGEMGEWGDYYQNLFKGDKSIRRMEFKKNQMDAPFAGPLTLERAPPTFSVVIYYRSSIPRSSMSPSRELPTDLGIPSIPFLDGLSTHKAENRRIHFPSPPPNNTFSTSTPTNPTHPPFPSPTPKYSTFSTGGPSRGKAGGEREGVRSSEYCRGEMNSSVSRTSFTPPPNPPSHPTLLLPLSSVDGKGGESQRPSSARGYSSSSSFTPSSSARRKSLVDDFAPVVAQLQPQQKQPQHQPQKSHSQPQSTHPPHHKHHQRPQSLFNSPPVNFLPPSQPKTLTQTQPQLTHSHLSQQYPPQSHRTPPPPQHHQQPQRPKSLFASPVNPQQPQYSPQPPQYQPQPQKKQQPQQPQRPKTLFGSPPAASQPPPQYSPQPPKQKQPQQQQQQQPRSHQRSNSLFGSPPSHFSSQPLQPQPLQPQPLQPQPLQPQPLQPHSSFGGSSPQPQPQQQQRPTSLFGTSPVNPQPKQHYTPPPQQQHRQSLPPQQQYPCNNRSPPPQLILPQHQQQQQKSPPSLLLPHAQLQPQQPQPQPQLFNPSLPSYLQASIQPQQPQQPMPHTLFGDPNPPRSPTLFPPSP